MVLPLALGQLARFTPMRRLHEHKPKVISRLSECVLLSIIYTTFCDTFASKAGERGGRRSVTVAVGCAICCRILAILGSGNIVSFRVKVAIPFHVVGH